MRIRKMLAYVLMFAMLIGNVTPAYAADTSGTNTISGDVVITSDEEGNLVVTDNSDEEQTPEYDNQGGSDEGAGQGSPEDGGDQGSTDGGVDQGKTDDGDDQGKTDEGADQGKTDDGDDQGKTDDGEDQGSTDNGGDQGKTDEEGDQGEIDDGGDQGSTDDGEDQGSTDDGEDQGNTDDGDDQGSIDDGDDKGTLDEGDDEEILDEEDNEGTLDDDELTEEETEEEDILEEEEEESLSDNSVSQNDIDVVKKEIPVKKNTNGTVVLRDMETGEETYYISIGEATGTINQLIREGKEVSSEYEITLLSDEPFVIRNGQDLRIISDDVDCSIIMFGKTLNVAGGVECNVSLIAEESNPGTILLGKGKSIQIYKKKTANSANVIFSNIKIDCKQDGKLIIGTPAGEDVISIEKSIIFGNVSLSGIDDLKIYDSFRHEKGENITQKLSWDIEKLDVRLNRTYTDNSGKKYSHTGEIVCLNNIALTVSDLMKLDGELHMGEINGGFSSLTSNKNTEVTTDSKLCLTESATIKNLRVNAGENPQFEIFTVGVGNKETKLQFEGLLKAHKKGIRLYHAHYNENGEPTGEINKYQPGEVIFTVSNENSTYPVLRSIFDTGDFNSQWEKTDETKKQLVENNGNIIIREYDQDYQLVDTYAFDEWKDAAPFIQKDTIADYHYDVTPNENIVLNGESLNLSSDSGARIQLFRGEGHEIEVSGKSDICVTSINTFDINIAPGAELKLIPAKIKSSYNNAPNHELNISANTFTFEGSSSSLVIGDEKIDVRDAWIYANDNIFIDKFDLTLLGNVNFMDDTERQYWKNKNESVEGADDTFLAQGIQVGTLTVKNGKESRKEGSHYVLMEEKAYIGIPVTADVLNLSGTLEANTVNAAEVTATAGSMISLSGASGFGNVTVNEKDSELYLEDSLHIYLREIFNAPGNHNTDSEPRTLSRGALALNGKVTPYGENPAVILGKYAMSFYYYDGGYETTHWYPSPEDGDVMVMINAENGDGSALKSENYRIAARYGNTWSVEVEPEGRENVYEVIAVTRDPKDATAAILSVHNSKDGTKEQFATLAGAKSYILRKSKKCPADTVFELSLMGNATVYADDLDYQDMVNGSVTLNLTGYTLTANGDLNINESISWVKPANAEDKNGTGTIKASNGVISFKALDRSEHHDLGAVNITAKEVVVERGEWDCNSITATKLYVQIAQNKGGESGQKDLFEKAFLNATEIIINDGGWMEVSGTVGSFDWNQKRPKVTLKGAKLRVNGSDNERPNGDCYFDTLIVAKAHSGESMEDYTIENNGQFFITTLGMQAGSIQNRGNMIVKDSYEDPKSPKTDYKIKDFHNENGGSLICNNFIQSEKGKSYLDGNSRLLINEKGVLYNVNLGSKNRGGGDPILGLGAEILEGNKVAADTLAELSINGTFTQNYEEQKLQIAVVDSYGPVEDLRGDMTYFNPDNVTVGILQSGDKLFTTNQEEFPTDSIFVLPQQVENDKQELVNNPNVSAIQSGTEIQVAGRTFTLISIDAAGQESILKDFTSWKEAIDYLSFIGNKGTVYRLEVQNSYLELGEALKLPANVASIEIYGSGNVPTELSFEGKLELTAPTAFNNVVLPDGIEIDTKGKWLGLYGINGTIKSLTGKTNGNVLIQDSNLTVSTDVVGMPAVDIVNSALEVIGDFEANALSLVNLSKNSSLIADNITINDIWVVGEGNELRYSDGLEIKGNLISRNGEGGFATEDVFADPIKDEETVLGYRIRNNQEEVVDKENCKTVKKNALNLYYDGEGDVVVGSPLAIAPKIPAAWFVYNRTVNEEDPQDIEIENVTYKEGNTIKYGMKGAGNDVVTLQVYSGNEEHPWISIDSYKTLQEAFDEIDYLDDETGNYSIIVNGDVTALDKENKITDYVFPSKAATICISGSMGSKKNITFKKTAAVKCDTTFENVILNVDSQEKAASLAIGGYSVYMLSSELTENISIVGSGIANGSEMRIIGDGDDYVRTSTIKDVDSLHIISTEVYVETTTTVGTIVLENYGLLCGKDTIKVGDVECHGEGTLVPFVTLTKDKKGVVTAVTSKLEITGELRVQDWFDENQEDTSGILKLQMGKDLEFESQKIEEKTVIIPVLDIYDGSDFEDSVVDNNKVILAKAPKVAINNVEFEQGSGFLYKKAGNIVYKNSSAAVILSYSAGGYEVETACETFADAVAEINNLKTKRDYQICFLASDEETPIVFTMPNNKYVDTLTLTSDYNGINTVCYTKDFNFTFPVILKDIAFEHMSEEKDNKGKVVGYLPTDILNDYPASINVKATGASITLQGEVSFNTPISLTGGKSTELIIDDTADVEKTRITAAPESAEVSSDNSYIQGKITGFKKVDLNQRLELDCWKTKEDVYAACEINVANLTLREEAELFVGNGVSAKNTSKVTDLILDGGELMVYGTGEFKNVTLSGDKPKVDIRGEKFNITGLITCAAEGAELVTGMNNTKGISALNISGKAVLENPAANRIMVQVVDEEEAAVALTGITQDEKGNDVYFSKPLLTAKNINANVFLVHGDCVEDTDDTEEYQLIVGEEDIDSGYFLKKKGDYVEVHHSDEIEAALCITKQIPGENDEDKEIPIINYYMTLNEAIAEIKALGDTTEEYSIIVLKDVGTSEAPYVMTVPEKAAKITFTSLTDSENSVDLYIKTSLNQKTNLSFEDINVENAGTWETKKFTLELNNANVTVAGKTTVDNLVLSHDAVLETANTTNISNITNVVIENQPNSEIICTKVAGLTIKGYITYVDENDTEIPNENMRQNFPFVIINAAGNATYVENTKKDIKNKEVVIGLQYDLSKATKLVTLEKETMDNFLFYNGDSSEAVNEIKNAVWTSKGIYALQNPSEYSVEVTKHSITEENGLSNQAISKVTCLDMTEAANYINAVADKNGGYKLNVEDGISDTKVTDSSAVSAFAVPGKDKAKLLHIVASVDQAAISFSGDLKVYGCVSVRCNLTNENAFSVSLEKNSNGESELELDNVAIKNLKKITGTKGISNVKITNCTAPSKAYLEVMEGITNVANMTLTGGMATKAASAVNNLIIYDNGRWDAYAAATIGNVVLQLSDTYEGNYPGTYLGTAFSVKNGKSTGNPQLTITGNVSGGKLPVKILDFYNEAGNLINKKLYDDAKLVLAKAEAADQFVAKEYATFDNEEGKYGLENGIISYKDKDGYIHNGSMDDKDVILSQKDEKGNWTDSYVKTYAEAIAIINGGGHKEAVYKITLLEPTTLTTGTTTAGAFALPKAGKAKSLSIVGEEPTDILKYTGAISANCDLTFDNLTLKEVTVNTRTKVESPVNEITLKPNSYQVGFGEKVSVETTATYKKDHPEKLVFKTIDGSKGTVVFPEGSVEKNQQGAVTSANATSVYVSGDIKLKELRVNAVNDDSRMKESSDYTKITCDGNITLTDLIYQNQENEDGIILELSGGKAITLTNVNGKDGENEDNVLNIKTYYTKKLLASSATQLTVNGDVDSNIKINIKPYLYNGYGYGSLYDTDLNSLKITANATPKNYQKVIKAPKMTASENVKLMYVNSQGIWEDSGLNAVKRDGGIYFTAEANGIEVVGYNEGQIEKYRAEFFTFEQAVKEIDALKHPEWTYEINVVRDQGTVTPLKSVTMPSKAAKVTIEGPGDVGILTTSTKISMKCPVEFRNISICAVKKTGNNYYSIPLTLDCGNFNMTLDAMKEGCDYDDTGWFNSKLKLNGSAKAVVEIKVKNQDYCGLYTQITNAGTVILNNAVMVNEQGQENRIQCHYDIKEGIKGVKHLELCEGVSINASKSEVSITDLTIGEATKEIAEELRDYVDENGNLKVDGEGNPILDGEGNPITDIDVYQQQNNLHSHLEAKNITVSGTAIMASSSLKAGTTAVGDGKITLNNVIFRDTYNHIEGKLDKKNNSLINIKGNVSFDNPQTYFNPQHWGAVCISLCVNNSVRNYAMLTEGMTIVTAPKAPASIFNAHYAWDENLNMGPGVDGYGFYKSGNDVKYGDMRQMEARVYVGTKSLEENGWKVPSTEFKTFEEAVKYIDSIALKKKDSKDFEDYVIELLRDVHIGNDKGDGKYSTLSLPSKASQVTIWGYGMERLNTMYFSGNVTLKCDTHLEGVEMMPMKVVKKVLQPTTMNLSVGNFTLTIHFAQFEYEHQGIWESTVNNVSGSTKGRLIILEDSYVPANNISGLTVEFVGDGEAIRTWEDQGTERLRNGVILAKGNFTPKEVVFKDFAAGFIQADGKFETNAIRIMGKTSPQIAIRDNNPIKIKGILDTNKVGDSVIFTDNNGEFVGETTDALILHINSSTEQALPTGTKVITGKYLNESDWDVNTYWGVEGYSKNSLYLSGTDLYLGASLDGED